MSAFSLLSLTFCSPLIPFNINVFPFLVPAEITGELTAVNAPLDLGPYGVLLPNFPPVQIPLNDVRISLNLDASTGANDIESATVEAGLVTKPSPEETAFLVTAEADVNIYISAGPAGGHFQVENRIPFGTVSLGTGAEILLSGTLNEEQLHQLAGEGLLIGLEFTNMTATIENGSDSPLIFNGFTWELTSLRIRGITRSSQ